MRIFKAETAASADYASLVLEKKSIQIISSSRLLFFVFLRTKAKLQRPLNWSLDVGWIENACLK